MTGHFDDADNLTQVMRVDGDRRGQIMIVHKDAIPEGFIDIETEDGRIEFRKLLDEINEPFKRKKEAR